MNSFVFGILWRKCIILICFKRDSWLRRIEIIDLGHLSQTLGEKPFSPEENLLQSLKSIQLTLFENLPLLNWCFIIFNEYEWNAHALWKKKQVYFDTLWINPKVCSSFLAKAWLWVPGCPVINDKGNCWQQMMTTAVYSSKQQVIHISVRMFKVYSLPSPFRWVDSYAF